MRRRRRPDRKQEMPEAMQTGAQCGADVSAGDFCVEFYRKSRAFRLKFGGGSFYTV